MGTTKKGSDWFGREIEEHFDDDGNKTGETRFTTDWLGNPVQEHFDEDGDKTGETRAGSDWLGNSRAEHFDTDGDRIGTSHNETTWLGEDVQRHYDAAGERVGETHSSTDWFGRPRKEHEGEFFKSHTSTEAVSSSAAYSGSSSSGEGTHRSSLWSGRGFPSRHYCHGLQCRSSESCLSGSLRSWPAVNMASASSLLDVSEKLDAKFLSILEEVLPISHEPSRLADRELSKVGIEDFYIRIVIEASRDQDDRHLELGRECRARCFDRLSEIDEAFNYAPSQF